MSTKSDSKLPRWATLSRKTSTTADQASWSEEDCYMRVRSYHSLVHTMEDAFQQSLQNHYSPMLEWLERGDVSFHQKRFVTNKTQSEEQPPKKKVRYTREVCRSYSPFFLPLVMLEESATTFLQDRLEAIQFIGRSLEARKNTVVINLLNLKDNWRDEIVRQCCSSSDYWRQTQKRYDAQLVATTDIMFSEKMKLWARSTDAPSNIVVCLQNIAGNASFHDFLRVVSRLRSQSRLPIQVVLLGPGFPQSNPDLKSYTQTYGVLTRTFPLASSVELLDVFWKIIRQKTPFMLLFSSFYAHRWQFASNRSCAHIVLLLQQVLVDRLLSRGSFLTLMTKELKQQEWQRIQLFCAHVKARAFAFGHASSMDTWDWCVHLEDLQSRLVPLVEMLKELARGGDQLDQILSQPNRSQLQAISLEPAYSGASPVWDLLVRICNICNPKNEVTVHGSGSHKNPLGSRAGASSSTTRLLVDLREPLYELIVLLEKNEKSDTQLVSRMESSDLLRQLLINFYYRVEKILQRAVTNEIRLSSEPLSGNKGEGTIVVAQPRRYIAQVLAEVAAETATKQKAASLQIVTGKMFRVISGRIAVSEEEWFELLLSEGIDRACNSKEASVLFACGVQQLLQCGLITERRTASRDGRVYEKPIVVWCSGIDTDI